MNTRPAELSLPKPALLLREALEVALDVSRKVETLNQRLEHARRCARVAYAQAPQPEGDLADLETRLQAAADQLCSATHTLNTQAVTLSYLSRERTERTPFDDPDGPESFELPAAEEEEAH